MSEATNAEGPLRPTPPDVEISAEELQADIEAGRRFYLPISFGPEAPPIPADDSKSAPWLDIVDVTYLDQQLAIYDPEGHHKADTKGAISYRRPTVLHALPDDSIGFEFRGAWIKLNAVEPSDPALADQFRDRAEMVHRIRERNERICLTPPTGFLEVAGFLPQTVPPARPKRKALPLAPLSTDGFLVTPSDRIHKAAIEALTSGAISPVPPEKLRDFGIMPGESWYAVHTFEAGRKAGGNRLAGVVGFKNKPEEAIWNTLQQNGPLAVKAHFALWARAYAETDAEPGRFVTLSIPQFCDDLGYARKKGAHRAERKREAVSILELLTSIDTAAIYVTPKGTARRLRGSIWVRGGIAEEMDGYADLFGSQREGEPSLWDPIAFSFAPGVWFQDGEWRKYNRNIALVGAGLLSLSSHTDQWAIMVGGYLVTLTRMNGYAPRVLRVLTILKASGMWRAESKHRHRMRDKLEKALEKLVAAGVIGAWDYTPESPDEPNMDDPEQLARLAEAADEDWTQKRIRVSWPEKLAAVEPLLKESRQKAIAAGVARARAAKRKAEDARKEPPS